MSKYSSDSDSSSADSVRKKRNKSSKSKARPRSSSSSSSDSHYSHKKRSTKHKRSQECHSGSHSGSRRSKAKRSSHRSRPEAGRSRSNSKTAREKHRSRSKEKSRRRSNDQSKRRSRSSSQESISSIDSRPRVTCLKQEPSTQEQLQAKLQKAMRAAQTADEQLRQQGLLTSGVTPRKIDLSETVQEPQISILDEINDSSFVPKQFTSTKSVSKVAAVDVSTVDLMGEAQIITANLEDPGSIFHSSLFVEPKEKLDKWVKKLYHLRQKAINGEPIVISE